MLIPRTAIRVLLKEAGATAIIGLLLTSCSGSTTHDSYTAGDMQQALEIGCAVGVTGQVPPDTGYRTNASQDERISACHHASARTYERWAGHWGGHF